MLNTAAQALGFKGDSVLNQIQSVFGLTEFGMTNETYYGDDNSPKQTTAFAIGKYITPKIYLHYSAGIGSNFNILYVRYLMTKRISLQTDANTRGTGADIFYSFETD